MPVEPVFEIGVLKLERDHRLIQLPQYFRVVFLRDIVKGRRGKFRQHLMPAGHRRKVRRHGVDLPGRQRREHRGRGPKIHKTRDEAVPGRVTLELFAKDIVFQTTDLYLAEFFKILINDVLIAAEGDQRAICIAAGIDREGVPFAALRIKLYGSQDIGLPRLKHLQRRAPVVGPYILHPPSGPACDMREIIHIITGHIPA